MSWMKGGKGDVWGLFCYVPNGDLTQEHCVDRLSASEAQKLNAMPQMQSRADAALFNFFFSGRKKQNKKMHMLR